MGGSEDALAMATDGARMRRRSSVAGPGPEDSDEGVMEAGVACCYY